MKKPIVNKYGLKCWRDNYGRLHREDGPALVLPCGAEYWYIHGKKHREDGPAIIKHNGDKYYFQNDKLHREDGPAIIKEKETIQYYFLNGRHQKKTEG
jgi:hypothetical protein